MAPNELIVARLIALAAETGLPVVITGEIDNLQIGVLNLVDLADDDYFLRPVSIDQFLEPDSRQALEEGEKG